jgi:hypothetical protein
MAKTLFNLTYELARLLGVMEEGTATGGSTTTIADTVERTEADDYWNGGTAWITYDAGGAGAAPEGEYSFITDFANTGGVVSLRSTLTAAVASGDGYAVARPRYPFDILRQKINEAIQNIGMIEITDISTITIASGQTEYALPSGFHSMLEVWIQGQNDSNDNQWMPVTNYVIEKEATGSGKTLILPQYTTGLLVKLVYLGYHSNLRISTDKLDESIHINRVLHNAAVGCLLWRLAKVGNADDTIKDLLNFHQGLAQRADEMFPIVRTRRKAKTANILL